MLEAVAAASWPWFGPISNNGTSSFLIHHLVIIDLYLVVRDFGFTLDEVNWLGNIISCVYLPTALLTPIITKRYGLKRCVCPVLFYAVYLLILLVQCDVATALILLSAWIRYAGTSRSLSKGGAYSLIIIGQVGKNPKTPLFYLPCFLQALSAISQPVYQILAPKYSERWFDLKGRTTATMIISIGIDQSLRMESLQLT